MCEFTLEDNAALGHFVRRWTARHVFKHATMIVKPESVDYRAMMARDCRQEWAWREDGSRATPADFVRDEIETGESVRTIVEHMVGEEL